MYVRRMWVGGCGCWGVYVGAWVGYVLGRACGVWGRVCGAPLYYPDTLVNLDTCLGSLFLVLKANNKT